MATLTAEFQYLGRSEKLAPKSGSYGYYILLYGKTEPNVETGFHAVTIREVMACTANSSFYNFASYYSGAVDGKTAFSGSKKPSSAWELGSFTAGGVSYSKGTVIAEGTIQVDATNGVARTAALSCLWKMNVDASATYVPAKGATGSVSVMAELSAIPRASSVTASDAYIGSSSIITINRSSSAFRHTLSYRMDGQGGFTTMADKTEAAQYGWTVPDEAYALIPNDREIDITIRCETYSGAVSLGYKETVMVASTRESACKPIIEAVSAIDVNPKTVALTGDNKVFVRGHSNAKVVTVATAQNKSSISSIVVSAGGKKAEGADVTIEGIETETVVVTVTDSRGYSDTYTVPWRSLVNYVPLTLNLSISREAPSSDVVHITATGNCFNGSFGAVDNALGVVMHYRPIGGSYGADVALSVSRSGNTYTATGTLPGLIYTNIYEVEVIASDAISGVPVTDKIKKGVPVYHWGEDFFRFHVPTTIPAEEPIVVPGAGTSDSAIDGEILAYAAGMGEGYFKFIYSPAAVHGVLGGSSLLVECFRVGGASAYALAIRVSSVDSGDIVSYVAKYETDGGFSGWRGVGDAEKVEALAGAISGRPYAKDSGIAYSKTVPDNKLTGSKIRAEIATLGGMTHKDGNTLKSAKVTEVESVGVNLIDPANVSSYANTTVANGVVTQTTADTNTSPYFKCMRFNGSTYMNSSFSNAVTSTGRHGASFEKTAEVTKIHFGLNGSARDTLVWTDVSHLPNGTYFVSVEFTNVTQGSISWKDMQINKGSTALPYTPYVRNTLTIPEAVQALDGYGDGINESVYNYIDFEKKQFVKRVDKIVFDGTEAWRQQSVNALGFANYELSCMTNADTSVRSIAICNLFEHDTNWIANVTREGFLVDTKTVVYFRSKSYTTLDAWKAYLAELYAKGNPLTFVYATLTQVTDISDILTDNNVEVEGNGTLTFKNEHGYDVPSDVGYYVMAKDGLKNLLASGNMVLSAYQYGSALPAAGTPGRIFFKKAGS